MYWWDRAADILAKKGSRTLRFGLVTTNSIVNEFNRRVVEGHAAEDGGISILMAIPDHPWTKATRGAAAVRIAMTVAAEGRHSGVLREVALKITLDTDEPQIDLSTRDGTINPNLTIGVNVTKPALCRRMKVSAPTASSFTERDLS